MEEHANKDMLWGMIVGLGLMVAALLAVAFASVVGYVVISIGTYVCARIAKFDIRSWALAVITVTAMWGFAFNVQNSDVLKQGKQEIINVLSNVVR